jgi:Protein of unknown function (DUF2891)
VTIVEWADTLRRNAATYAQVAMQNIEREFPSDVWHRMQGPDDLPRRPRERTPVFFGSFDWHSCVEMHWVLVRLLRVMPDAVPQAEIKRALGDHFTPEALRQEAQFIGNPDNRGRQRPYGWGWALQLVHDVQTADDPDARSWAASFEPLAETLTRNFLEWLPKATYPIRYGVHPNSAFGFSRALPYARTRAQGGDRRLLSALTDKALQWFGRDTDYPARWEPSGADFLSPALTEAELMGQLLPTEAFASWLTAFLPGIADHEPAALFTPAVVSDASDGQIAHLHGLNASRAWCWRRLAELLPPADPRVEPALTAMRTHAAAALPHVAGDDYMVEHWLAAYAVLLMS